MVNVPKAARTAQPMTCWRTTSSMGRSMSSAILDDWLSRQSRPDYFIREQREETLRRETGMRTWNAEGQGRRGNRQMIKKEESKPRLGSIRNNRKEAYGDTSTLADMYIYVLPPAPYRRSSISSSPWTGEGKGGRAGIYGSQAENFHFSQGKTNSKPTHERPLLQQGARNELSWRLPCPS